MRRLLGFPLLCALAACGGDSPTHPAGPTVVEVEQRSFDLANGERAAAGAPPLALSDALSEVARAYSAQMRDEGFFGHRGPDGRDLAARLQDAGISFRAAAENLAQMTGIPDPAGWAHDQLMASVEHRENILHEGFRLAGVGVAQSGETYWLTQIFVEP